MNKHEIYVVGGAIRNTLMGVPVKDMDYVVVGATAEEMLSMGYTRVGQDFPVFLHPVTGDEYALARTERKKGKGYHGFITVSDPNITLEMDLGRRDLTVNAMAVHIDEWERFQWMVANPETDEARIWMPIILIDPFGGQKDLKDRIARPCALDTFVEDPLRLVRAARFSAVYGLTWSNDMYAAAHHIIDSGELVEISRERYFAEIEKVINQCTTAGPIAKFSMRLHQFDLLDYVFEYSKAQSIVHLMRYKAHRSPAESMGAKLMAFCPESLIGNYKERFCLSNSFVDQLDFAYNLVNTATLVTAHRAGMPLCHDYWVAVQGLYEGLRTGKECITVQFAEDLAKDYPDVQLLVDLFPKLDEIYKTVCFDTVCKGVAGIEPRQYSGLIQQARLKAIQAL